MAPTEVPIQTEVAHTWYGIGLAAPARAVDREIAVGRIPSVFPFARSPKAVIGILYGISRREESQRGNNSEGEKTHYCGRFCRGVVFGEELSVSRPGWWLLGNAVLVVVWVLSGQSCSELSSVYLEVPKLSILGIGVS